MFIEIGGRKIHYQQSGRGKPILLVHGWGGSINSLNALRQLLAQKYQTTSLDLPGFGQSDPPHSSWGVTQYGELLANFIKHLELTKITFFGHSFGGSLGIFLAVNYPELINKLILCASSFKRENKTSVATKTIKKFGQSIPILNQLEQPLKKIYYRIFFPDSDLVKFPHLESNFKKIMSEDLTSYLVKIRQSTLILWGSTDHYIPVKQAYELKQKITNSRLVLFENIGHNLPLKYPKLIYQEIEKFI